MASLRILFAVLVTTLLLVGTSIFAQLILGAPRSLFSPCSEYFSFSIPLRDGLTLGERRRVGVHCSHAYNLNASLLLRGSQVFEEQSNNHVEPKQMEGVRESPPTKEEETKSDALVPKN